jgi:hypothetical protein
VLLPGRSVMYHLWRANLGNNTTPNASRQFSLISKNWPILVVDSNNTPTSTDWPAIPAARARQRAELTVGTVIRSAVSTSSVRHTPNSHRRLSGVSGRRAPEPKPWYYKDPPSNADRRSGSDSTTHEDRAAAPMGT